MYDLLLIIIKIKPCDLANTFSSAIPATFALRSTSIVFSRWSTRHFLGHGVGDRSCTHNGDHRHPCDPVMFLERTDDLQKEVLLSQVRLQTANIHPGEEKLDGIRRMFIVNFLLCSIKICSEKCFQLSHYQTFKSPFHGIQWGLKSRYSQVKNYLNIRN